MKWENNILKPISWVASNSRKNLLVSASHGWIFKWNNYMHAIFARLSASLLNMVWSSSSPIWVQNSRMELSFEFSWKLFWNLAQFCPLCKIIFDHSTVPWVAFFCIFQQWQDYFVKKVNYYSMYNVLSYAHVIMWGLGRFVFMESGVHGWSWGGTTKETVSRCPRVCISALFLGVRTLNLRCNLQG